MKKLFLLLLVFMLAFSFVEARDMNAPTYTFNTPVTFKDAATFEGTVISGDTLIGVTLGSDIDANSFYIINSPSIKLDTTLLSVTVGATNDDFTTINSAIEYLQANYYPIYSKNADYTASIILQDDYIMDEQVLINGIDLGWIEIHGPAENTQISITSIDTGSVFGVVDTTTYYYAKFNITGHDYVSGDNIIIIGQKGYEEEQYYNGIWKVNSVGTGWIQLVDVFMDSIKAGVGGSGTSQELIAVPVKRSAMTELFETFYYPAFGVARGTLPTIGCIFEMDASANAQAGHQSYIDGLCATDHGVINILPYCGFRKADGTNIYGTRNSTINANDAIADSAGRHGIWAYSNTTINARRAYVANCGYNDVSSDRGDGWLASREPAGCGIASTRGSIINADGATVINTLGDCISAYYGGIINVGNTDESGVIAGGSVNGKTINSEPGGIITGLDTYGRNIEQGGHKQYYDIDDNPGPNYLIAGNKDCGFFGEVTVDELFGTGKTSDTLMANLDITQGTAINTSANWLKYIWNDKVLYYPKKPIRHSISWDHIYLKGCVYGTGTTISIAEQTMLDSAEAVDTTAYKDWVFAQSGVYRVVQSAQTTINGKAYRVRLLRGAHEDPIINASLASGAVGRNNEWNRLILPLHTQTQGYNWSRVIDGSADYSSYVNTITPDWGIYYTDADLITHHSYGSGSYTWCANFTETYDVRRRVLRGLVGASRLSAIFSWDANADYGLRLVLEEI